MVHLMYRALMRFKNPHRLCTQKVLMTTSSIPKILTSLLEGKGGTDQPFESTLKTRRQVTPVLWFNLMALQDRGDFLSYGAPFILSKDTTGPINQFEIIREPEGQSLGHLFPGSRLLRHRDRQTRQGDNDSTSGHSHSGQSRSCR
jgi:hypothetical protein